MRGSRDKLDAGDASPRCARWTYAALLVASCAALALHPEPGALGSHPLALGVLIALSLAGYAVSCAPLRRVGRVFDCNVALGLVALVVAGPLGLLAVAIVPDLVHLVRRRRAFLGLGLVANLASWTGEAAVAGALLRVVPDSGGPLQRTPLLLGVGVVLLTMNFLLVRLLLGVVRDREWPARLVREELLAVLPLQLLVLSAGVACALCLPTVGVAAFATFTVVATVPQLVAARLLHAPSVAALTVDEAAAVYRDALVDELRLPRADRRLAHLVDARVQHRPLPEAPVTPAVIQDALLVTICAARPPTQPHFSASPRSQVVLVARRWAELTARCTPALNHHEALAELRRSGLLHDAPLAVAAVQRITEREHALTEHVAGVPRLHRAPLPRTLRHDLLPVALERLAA